MNCGFGAVKCLEIVDGRVWGGTRGGICAWNIDVIFIYTLYFSSIYIIYFHLF